MMPRPWAVFCLKWPKKVGIFSNIPEKNVKNYLQSGFRSYIIIRHGKKSVVKNTTHPVIAPPRVLCKKGGQCEMIGVEDKTKGEKLCLSYL